MKLPTLGKWQRDQRVLHSAVGEEVILMSIQNSYYYGLDAIAGRIWELLQQPHSLSELCDTLQQEYDVDQAICQQETYELLQALQDRKLVQYQEK